MMRMARLVLGAAVVGLAVTFGCLVPPHYDDSVAGQGGTTTMTATTGTGAGVPCSPASPCEDDENACTTEACMSGFCTRTPLTMGKGPGSTDCMTIACSNGVSTPTIHNGDACGMGLTCVGKVCTGCTADADCGKTDECQTSICQPGMKCTYGFKPIGTKVVTAKLPDDMNGDCRSSVCNGTGTILLLTDDTDVPDDGLECTDGHCMNGAPGQSSPSAMGAPCANGTTFCNTNQSCVVCAVDANCAMGATCYQQKECVSCADTKKNGDETDADCGGACGNTCNDGDDCKIDEDCVSDSCASGKCISCSDGVKNGDELAPDCGGSCAQKCGIGTLCSNSADCSSGHCTDGVCCHLACAGPCIACNIPMNEGICAELPNGHDDPNSVCAGSQTCKTGACVDDEGKKHFGEPCTNGLHCFSGICAGQPPTCY